MYNQIFVHLLWSIIFFQYVVTAAKMPHVRMGSVCVSQVTQETELDVILMASFFYIIYFSMLYLCIFKAMCGSINCSQNATCEDGKCMCKPGYTRNGTECDPNGKFPLV